MQGWLAYTTALLLVPVAAGAEVFTHGIGSEGYWTNNVYGNAEDLEVDDGSVRVLPWAQLEDPEGDFAWSLRYSPSYEYYFQESEARGDDHDALATLRWRVAPTTTLTLSELFRRNHTIARFNETTEPGQDLLLQSRRSEITSNWATTGVQHYLSPRDFVSFTGSYGIQDLSQEEATDSEFLAGDTNYRHQLSERTAIGTTLSFSRQTTKPGERRDSQDPDQTDQQLFLAKDRDTDFYNLSGVVEHAFSPTLRLVFSAGPALVVSDDAPTFDSDQTSAVVSRYPLIQDGDGTFFIDANTCPSAKIKVNGSPTKVRFIGAGCRSFSGASPLTDGQRFALNAQTQGNTLTVPIDGLFDDVDDSSPTYFADVTLTKEWQRWTGELTYRRSEDPSSNVGAISDTIFGRLRWQITSRLSTSLLTGWERREQASEFQTTIQVVDNAPTPLPAFDEGARSQLLQRVTLDNDLSVDVVSAYWHVNYQLGERTELYWIASYRDERPQDVASSLLQDVNRYGFTVGVRYSFDPIPF